MRTRLVLFLFCMSIGLVAQNPPKKDWAKYEKYSAANEVILQAIAADPDAAPKAVFMGNSITELWAKHRASFFADNGYVPRGISGQTTYQMLARFQRDVVDLHPEAVVILAGINDIAENSGPISIDNIVGNIKSMCDIAWANGIQPILCSVLPCDYLSWRKDLTPAQDVVDLNTKILALAQSEGIAYVDYYTALDNGQGGLGPEHSGDRCHPNEAGYQIMENIIQAFLMRL